jgi:hypothetical protein
MRILVMPTVPFYPRETRPSLESAGCWNVVSQILGTRKPFFFRQLTQIPKEVAPAKMRMPTYIFSHIYRKGMSLHEIKLTKALF